MNGLSPAERNRLAGILGLLGSSHQGERDAAALAADRLVRGRGLAWSDLLGGGDAQPSSQEPPHDEASSLRADIFVCQQFPGLLTQWERQFLETLRRRSCALTPNQRRILSEMASKVRGG